MAKGDQTFYTLIIAAAASVGIAYYAPRLMQQRAGIVQTVAEKPKAIIATAVTWAASAPGRIEPQTGELKIAAPLPARIIEIVAKTNDVVAAGDLLVRLDDGDLEARLGALEADIASKRRDRDQETVGQRAQERRTAEDNSANAERSFWAARAELDRIGRNARTEKATAADLQKAREALVTARDRLDQAKSNLRRISTADGLPAPTRLEVAVAAARAELAVAEAQLERTRIRAPQSGTVISVISTVGDIATPSPEAPVMVLGDIRTLRVRAELDERDIGKIRVGQGAVIRVDAFPGRDFEGRVAQIAQALQPARLMQKGPRKATDVDVLEVLIDLGPQPALLSGMRADVFIKPQNQATAQDQPR
jgi:HlyD family secretion protein